MGRSIALRIGPRVPALSRDRARFRVWYGPGSRPGQVRAGCRPFSARRPAPGFNSRTRQITRQTRRDRLTGIRLVEREGRAGVDLEAEHLAVGGDLEVDAGEREA